MATSKENIEIKKICEKIESFRNYFSNKADLPKWVEIPLHSVVLYPATEDNFTLLPSLTKLIEKDEVTEAKWYCYAHCAPVPYKPLVPFNSTVTAELMSQRGFRSNMIRVALPKNATKPIITIYGPDYSTYPKFTAADWENAKNNWVIAKDVCLSQSESPLFLLVPKKRPAESPELFRPIPELEDYVEPTQKQLPVPPLNVEEQRRREYLSIIDQLIDLNANASIRTTTTPTVLPITPTFTGTGGSSVAIASTSTAINSKASAKK